jgi:hypothetical protein
MLALLLAITTALATEGATLSRDTVPATGVEEAVLDVERFGRFSVSATSEQGTRVTLIDRMSGRLAGTVFEGDSSRIDLFLERGEYKLVATSDELGKGDAKLDVRRAHERNGERPVRLPEFKWVSTTMADHQQRSYWVDVTKNNQAIPIEAAGRHLVDMRFWKDGSWLVDHAPTCDEIEPVSGQPMRRCTAAPSLPVGLYLVTLYGGPSKPWSEESEATDLHLRWGVPRLPASLRATYAVGPLGFDRYEVPSPASYFRVELPENAPVELVVAGMSKAPFQLTGRSHSITDESRIPVAEVDAGSGNHLVVVKGPVGQRYTLQHFDSVGSPHTLSGSGSYFVATLHAGFIGDDADATAVAWDPKSSGWLAKHRTTIRIDKKKVYTRKFNLMENTSLFIEVLEAGTYTVQAPTADIRVQPLMVRRPKGYQVPETSRAAWSDHLSPGLYSVELLPFKPGIGEVGIAADTWGGRLLGAVGAGPKLEQTTVRPGFVAPEVSLSSKRPLKLWMSRQPDVRRGVVKRQLPVDLREALAFSLLPGEAISIKAKTREAGVVRALAENGEPLQLNNAGIWTRSIRREPGDFTVVVLNDQPHATWVSLGLVPDRLAPDAPLPTLTPQRLMQLPSFPNLTSAAPATFDLDRKSQKTFLVQVDDPALYRLQSTGLLATGASVRTRVRIGFASAAENGTGRNFVVSRYLREGTYQVTLQTRGMTRGHLGLELETTPLIAGGSLTDGVPARTSLVPGRGAVYTFTVDEASTWNLASIGRGRSFTCRLEDADGWPLHTPPVQNCARREHLPAGDYRLVLMPEEVTTRRITRIDREPVQVETSGHGPHPLVLSRRASHVWREPANDGDERTPDRWTFTLPAPATVSLSLSDEMAGELLDSAGERVGRLLPGNPFSGSLDAGAYTLELRGARRNNGIRYTVSANPRQLLAGQHRTVQTGSSIPVSVGERQLVEITSFGKVDARARLLRGSEVIATSDDRPNDWNFRIAERLDAGEYTLRIDALDGGGEIALAMSTPREVDGGALGFGTRRSLDVDRAVHTFDLPGDRELLTASATSDETVGVAIEAFDDGVWVTVGAATGTTPRLAVRSLPDAPHRLRVWSLDHRGNPVRFAAHAPKVKRVGEAGARAISFSTGKGPFGAATLSDARPGLFALGAPRTDLLVCPGPGRACEPAGPVVSAAHGLWLVGAAEQARAARIELSPSRPVLAPVPVDAPIAVDVAASAGPVLIRASSPAGQPALRLGTTITPAGTPMGLGRRAAAAVELTGSPGTAVVWSASDEPLDVRLQATNFAAQPAQRAPPGLTDGRVPAGAAAVFDLAGDGRDVRVALEHGLVAVFSEDDAVRTVHWAADGALEERVVGAAGRLTVLNPGESTALFTVELLPGATTTPVVQPGQPFEFLADRAGHTRIDVSPTGGTVELRGAIESALYLRANGDIARGTSFEVGAGGTLWLSHTSGPVLAWVGEPWSGDPSPAVRVGATARVGLSGVGRTLRLQLGAPGMAHLRTPTPVIARIRPDEGAERVEVHAAGARIDAYFPTGEGEIELRGLAGTHLWGEVALTSTPAVSIGEGLGPEVLLPPGGTRLFSFELDQDGPVGIGVRATADRVEATLYSTTGERRTTGLVQMPELTSGTWLLTLTLPPDAAPVRARPALAGVEHRDTGPPEAVITSYLELAGLVSDAEESP